MSRARLRTTPSLPTAHNKRHQSPTCPSGHLVTNPLLKPSSRFQVTFVTNSSSTSRGSRTGPGHANRRRDSSLSKLARPCSLHEPNPTYGSQFVLAVCPTAQGKLITASRRHSERFPHIYAFAALCRTPPLWGRGGRSGPLLGHSREFPTFSPKTSRGRISLTRYPISVFFSLLESSSL